MICWFGEGEVLNSVSPSAAVVGSAASSLSGVILTEGVMSSSSDKDEDRRSVREAREEAAAKEGFPDAKESKKKRRRRKKKKGKTPGEESKVDKPKEDEMEEVEVEGEEPAQSSKPPVRPPPVGPPKVKKDHLKQKVDKGRKGKDKGEKGKGKDKGKGKKGKGKGEVASPSKPRSRPPEPPTPPPGFVAGLGSTSRNVMAGMGGSPTKPKLDLPGSGFTKSATGRLRCDFCRKRGHIARFCPEITFRVSLTDSSIRPQKKEEKPPPQPEEHGEEEDVAIHLKERREVRRELRQRAQEAREALEEADRKMKEAKGHTHPVTPEEQKVLDQQRQEGKDLSSYSYYTSSEDEPGEELRLVPNAEVKEDPKDPSSSESSSDDDDEGEEEEREADPDEEAREAVEENKGENSDESELFESDAAPIASGKSALASKGKPALVEAKGQKVPVQLPSRPSAGTPKAMPSTLARAETKRLADDRVEMRRLREESRALDQAHEQNERERKRLQGELKALRQKRRAEDAAAIVAEEERTKKKKAEDEVAAKKKAEEAEAQRKADEEEARRIAEEKEAQLKVDQEAEELQKAMEFADQLQKEAEKAERKAQKAATKAEREPEESDQKAKKVRKAKKAKAKAELAMSKLKAERGAVSNLRWHGNRVGMPRIDFLHDKPEGWKEMWNQRLAAWKARHPEAQKKEDKEKAKGEQPHESGDKKKKSEPERPGHRLEAQRKIPMAQDPWSRPTVFWNQSWNRICELSRKKEGEGFVFFCGSQGCRKTFKNELAYWQHLWSKCDTPGHPSREIVKRWSTDKPFVAVSGDPDHPDPQWVEKQQKELKEKMRKEIQDHEDEKAKKLRRAQGKEEESSSTGSGSTDSEDDDEVSKAATKVGIAVESLGPVGPEDSDIPEIPDGESLVAFLEDKKAEKAAKKEKVLAEESAASKRKSGVTEAGKRMLDQTLDEIVVDIKEEVPPSQRNALFGLPESPTSPAGAPAEESAGVESAPTAPTIPSTGIPISAVTEQEVPKDHDSKLETCKACAGSGRADPDMNEAIQVLLDAQKASMASVSQEVKKEDSPKGKDADSQDKDNRLGAFTFCEGVATDFCIVELCCNRFSELSRAAKVLGCSYLGVHDQLEVPSTCQQVLKTLRLAIAEGKKVEGKKVGRVYCHLYGRVTAIEFF